jgi:hypothetical protein
MKAIRNGISRNKKEMFLLNRKGYSKESTAAQECLFKEQKRMLLLHQCWMQRAL